MAVPSTAATLHISGRNLSIQSKQSRTHKSNNANFPNGVAFALKHHRFFITIRSSSDVSPSNATEVVEEEGDAESSIEVPEGPPSLISALNVERALRGIPIADVDYYAILGVSTGCSLEQVAVAYKKKVDELLNLGLDEEQVREKMELLNESYTILSTPEERRMYDWSLARSEEPDRYTWPFEVDKAKIPTETTPQQEPEDTGPTILMGYFIFGWLFLSFALSIAFNR